jgi:hypothetical protein
VHPDAVGNITFSTTTAGLTVTADGPNGLAIDLAGGGVGIQDVTSDVGGPTAPNGAGNINFLGAAGHIVTTGNGLTNTVTWDTGATIAGTYTSDAGVATPALGNLNILGGTGCATAGAGDTITVDIDADVATSYVTDNGTAIPVNNIINIVGAGDFATYGSGNTISIGAAADTRIITDFVANGVWTKNPLTQFVDIYVWSGGGGGGSSGPNLGGLVFYGGNGGTQGSVYVMLQEPTATFGVTENIVVGAGGAGGPILAPVPGNGAAGSVSSVGAIIVPPIQDNGGLYGSQGSFVGKTNNLVYIAGSTTALNGGGKGGYGAGAAGNPSDSRSFSSVINEALVPTGGGGGGGHNTTSTSGGTAGSIKQSDGTTIVLGGKGGTVNLPAPDRTNGSDGVVYSLTFVGGTGGGGGAANGHLTQGAFSGGDGGFPGGGGGGGGCKHGMSGLGGNGGNGLVRIIEYL